MKVREFVALLQAQDQELLICTQNRYLAVNGPVPGVVIEVVDGGYADSEGEFVSTGPEYIVLA